MIRNIKIVTLGFLTISASLSTIYSFNNFFTDLNSANLLLSGISAFFLLILITLNVFFIRDLFKIGLIVFLASAAPFILSYSLVSKVTIVGGALFFFFLMVASQRGARILINSLKIRFFAVASFVVPKAITGLLIFLTVLFFANYFDFENGALDERINQVIINYLVNSSEPIVRIFLPGFSADQTTSEFLTLVVKDRIKSIEPDFDRLLPAVQTQLLETVSQQLTASLQARVGLFDAEKSLSDNFFNLTTQYLDNSSKNYKLIFSIALSLLIFLVLKGITSLLSWLVELVAFIIFKFLLILNFAYISLESRSQEHITLS